MKLLKLVMLQSLIICLLLLNSCKSVIDTTFNADWEFLKNKEGETKACLSQNDVVYIKSILRQCSEK